MKKSLIRLLTFGSLSLFIFFILWLFTFNFYPQLVSYYLILFEPNYNSASDVLGKGTYGDMFGALNTFFSGLAFIGLLATIGIQIYIHQREIELEKLKLNQEKEEIKLKHDKYINDKLTYLLNLFHRIVDSNQTFLENISDWLENSKEEKVEIPTFSFATTDNILSLVAEKINQEEFYHSYREKIQNDEILDAFIFIESSLTLRIQIKNWIVEELQNVTIQKTQLTQIHSLINLIVNSKASENTIVTNLYKKHLHNSSKTFANIDILANHYRNFLSELTKNVNSSENRELINEIHRFLDIYNVLISKLNNLKNNIRITRESLATINIQINTFLNLAERALGLF